jgi:hypothetical protein
LPEGGTIAEGVVTENPTIELTPANPEVESQKLVIKGGLGPVDHHLHLTTGDLSETSIFLGTDELNVRTTTNGTIQITTPTEGSNVWEFGNDGSLILPTGVTNNGRISNINGISLAVDTGFWIFGTDGSLTIPGDIRSESDINITVNSEDSSSYTWNFGQTGNLIFPDDTVQSTAYTGLLTTAAATGGVEFNLSTALDLTKSIQKLTAGYYSLADGVEGQIMYFVPVNGVTQGSSVGIVMANVRQFVNGTVAVINNAWFPFFQNAIIDDGNPEAFNASTIAYAIFTDGAWNVFGGGMD